MTNDDTHFLLNRLEQARAADGQQLFQTFILVEVLSDRPCAGLGLKEIAREIEEGDFSGQYDVVFSRRVTPKEMSELLIEQGSDPDFLGCGTEEENEQWH
jgi:hypothetical protein